jgi:CheY-like chemotaxis protein
MTSRKVLVADDSLTIQKVIRLALANEGYEIQAVSDGNDALEQISLFRPDVVLIDVSLPLKSAIEVKRETDSSDDQRRIKFILMSSAFEEIDENSITAARFDGRLIKPFDPAHLRQVLTDVLKQTLTEVPLANDLWSEKTPPPPPAPPTSDEDIKRLTESTLKMSGFDDFQWSVNEPATVGDKTLTTMQVKESQLEPFSNLEDAGGSTFSLDPPPAPPPANFSSSNADVLPLSDDEIQEHIDQKLEQTLRKMLQAELPSMAERIIKEEIRKMLANPPTTP